MEEGEEKKILNFLTTFNGTVPPLESRGRANKSPALTFQKLLAVASDLELYWQRWLLIDRKIGSSHAAALAGCELQRRPIAIPAGLEVSREPSMPYRSAELKNAPVYGSSRRGAAAPASSQLRRTPRSKPPSRQKWHHFAQLSCFCRFL